MKMKLYHWFNLNRTMLINASSLVGTMSITSTLGFVYWWVAAHHFPPEAVGLASAAISAMMLLGNIGMIGLGTLLIGELPRQTHQASSLITTALITVGIVGGMLGLLFTLIAPQISTEFKVLVENSQNTGLFTLGVSLTTVSFVLDQAMIGLLRGDLQLWRNTIFAVAKLGALVIFGILIPDQVGLTIYAAWAVGNIVSLVAMIGFTKLQRRYLSDYRPQWGMLRKLGRAALVHHSLNLTLQAPGLTLPVVVTALLSAQMNAYFYTAWMIASFAFVGPMALTTVLYAVGSGDPTMLRHKIRLTLMLSFGVALLASSFLLIGANFVLGLFKGGYAEHAGWSLRLLGLGVWPIIIRSHYVAIRRIRGQIGSTAAVMIVGGILELALAAVGASFGSLIGLSIGWLVAVCGEAAFMLPVVYFTATREVTLSNQQVREVNLSSSSISVG